MRGFRSDDSAGWGGRAKSHFGDFCVIIFGPPDSPAGQKLKDGESKRVRKREPPVFSHTSLQILLLPKLASLGTDCHASLPSMDNQSFFEEPSMGARALGSPPLPIGEWRGLRSWGISLPSTLAM